MAEPQFDAAGLAVALQQLNEFAQAHAPAVPSAIRETLVAHFGQDPVELPIVTDEYPPVERPNLQLALDAWAAATGRSIEALGLTVPHRGPMELGLGELLTPSPWGNVVGFGPVSYVEAPCGPGVTMSCLATALLLLRDGDRRMAGLLTMTPDMGMRIPQLQLQVLTADASAAAAFLAELRRLMIAHNVYRGQVISLTSSADRGPMPSNVGVQFHERPTVGRDALILADGVLERIERQVASIAIHAEELRATGRDVKRGLLLYGPPGTGKTLTVRYLSGLLPDRTVLLVAGADLGGLSAACRLARALTPATVVLEDVDLVAEERTFHHGHNQLMAALLNEMDTVDGSQDVVFLLTTNRADLLEPALATRPGRIDQAVEVILPDAACRARLIELYAGGISIDPAQRAALVDRLDGVSAAFIKELMRRAAVLAAIAGGVASHDHVTAALDELYSDAGALTRTLLGADAPSPDPQGSHASGPFPWPRGQRPSLTIPAEVLHQLDQ
jgi:DNA polymerase III delta prime subunit